MKQTIHCPHCAQQYHFGPELNGKRVKCRKCSGEFGVSRPAQSRPQTRPVAPASIKPAAPRPSTSPQAPMPRPPQPATAQKPRNPSTVFSSGPIPTVPVGRPAPVAANGNAMAPVAKTPSIAPVAGKPSLAVVAIATLAASDAGMPLLELVDEELSRPALPRVASVSTSSRGQLDDPLTSVPQRATTSARRSAGGGVSNKTIWMTAGSVLASACSALICYVIWTNADGLSKSIVNAIGLSESSSDPTSTAGDSPKSGGLGRPAPWPPGAYEAKLNEGLALMQEMCNLAASIQDRPSAAAAVPRIAEIQNRLLQLGSELQRMEAGNQRSAAECQLANTIVPQINAAKVRMEAETRRVQELAAKLQIDDTLARIGIGSGSPQSVGQASPNRPVSIQTPRPHHVPHGPRSLRRP
jgi:hypothetical protein